MPETDRRLEQLTRNLFAFPAPGEVTSLGVDVNVTTLNIKWNKPETTNGPIDGYLVDVTEKGTNNVVSKSSKENFLTIIVDNEYTR